MEASDELKVTVREEPRWKRVLSVEVAPAAVSREEDHLVEATRKKMALPGFRKGKVPKEVARKIMAADLDGEVLQRVLPRAYTEALRRTDIDPVGDPIISDLHYHRGEPLTFTATVEVLPTVEITGYKGLKVTKEVPEVHEDMVDRTLDMIREGRATPTPVERPAAKGDLVHAKYAELDAAGEPKPGDTAEVVLEVGGPRTPETFSEGLLGTVAGDVRDIPLSYPADYPDEALAGSTRTFRVTVGNVEEKVWPALDDTLAKEVLGQDEASVQGLRDQIRVNHEAEAQLHARRRLEGIVVSRLLELNPFELPEGMIASALDRVVHKAREDHPQLTPNDEERMREEYRPLVERRYKTDLLLESVARQEEIRVTEEDLDREIARFAEREGQPAEKIKAELRKENGLDRLARDVFTRRVMEKLMEYADVTEITVPGQPQEEF